MTATTQPGGRVPAPGELAIVQEFLNSNDLEGGRDELSDPAALRSWLLRRALPAAALRRQDYERAIRTREALRSLLRREKTTTGWARDALHDLARDVTVSFAFRLDGRLDLSPRRRDFSAALAQLLAIVYRAGIDGTWARMKICRNDACQWAYYDHSRNASGRWCTMRICGGQAKARAFRRRKDRGGKNRAVRMRTSPSVARRRVRARPHR